MRPPAEENCRALIAQSYALLDASEYAMLAELFTKDGVWHRGGHPRRGRKAIIAALDERLPERKSMHIVTNAVIRVTATGADGTAYVMVTRGPAASAQVEHWVVTDRYELTPEGWRIAERKQEREASA
jgi:uncharacterized protein (TIGR02246 family)